MKTILCYGDSNTWGQVPLPLINWVKQRHLSQIRWPGCLRQIAGDAFHVIEEGLNGRTTGVDDPIRDGRNAKTHLKTCLDSHVPLDLVIFMLGTNDLKIKFDPDPERISQRMRELVQTTKSLCAETATQPTQILLMAPVIPKRAHVYPDFQYEQLENFARQLIPLYEEISRLEHVYFFDASQHLEASTIDGVHIEASGHQRFARTIFQKINSILEQSSTVGGIEVSGQ